jgi:hypothetical protein
MNTVFEIHILSENLSEKIYKTSKQQCSLSGITMTPYYAGECVELLIVGNQDVYRVQISPTFEYRKICENVKVESKIYHSSVIYKDVLYILGGEYPNLLRTPVRHFYEIDLGTETNNKLESPFEPISHHTATVYQDRMYIFGIFANATTNLNPFITIYDFKTQRIENLDNSRSGPISRRSHSMTVFE